MNKTGKCLKLVLAVTLIFSTSFPVRTETIDAQWEVHQIRFRYAGFSSHYTCDGIERTVKRLLILMGARGDVRVESKCNGRNRVQAFHDLLLAFAIPVPADKTDIDKEIIPAEWQEVRITGKLSRYLDAGDCELLEQFQRYVLPQLNVRSLKKNIHCIPNRLTTTGLNLRMLALKTLKKEGLENIKSKPTQY